jgi:hypothetical protein
MAILYKQGVFGELTDETSEGLRLTEKFFGGYYLDVVITSKRDGSHGVGSFHPHGRAFDVRLADVDVAKWQSFLGNNYQIIEEKTHFHVEYDPKK